MVMVKAWCEFCPAQNEKLTHLCAVNTDLVQKVQTRSGHLST